MRANIRAQGLRSPPSAVLEDQVLERLVLREIQLQRAKRFGIEISDEQVNRGAGFRGAAERSGVERYAQGAGGAGGGLRGVP